MRGRLLRECEDFDRGRHRMEPNALEQVLNILLHELIRGEDEPKRVARNVRSLLKQTPRFLDEAETLIDEPEPVWRRTMEQTSVGAPALFEAIATFLDRVYGASGDKVRIESAQRGEAATKQTTDYPEQPSRNRMAERELRPTGSAQLLLRIAKKSSQKNEIFTDSSTKGLR